LSERESLPDAVDEAFNPRRRGGRHDRVCGCSKTGSAEVLC
jgi:hypothetical protein